jgi:hypothetical protein
MDRGGSQSIQGGRDRVEELRCRNIRDLEYQFTIASILIPGKNISNWLEKQKTIPVCAYLLVTSGNGCVLQ